MSKYINRLNNSIDVFEIRLLHCVLRRISADPSDYAKMQRAIERLQLTLNMQNACRAMPASTAEELGFKVILLERCKIAVIDAQRELDELQYRLLHNWAGRGFKNVNRML